MATRKDRIAAKKLKIEYEKARQAHVKRLSAVPTFLDRFHAFKTFTRGGVALNVEYLHSESMPKELKQWCFELVRSNMMHWYEGSWGWNDAETLAEMNNPDARYLICREQQEPCKPVAFAYFAFETQDLPQGCCVYLYEIQLEPKVRGLGLGKFLMQLVELIARTNGVDCIRLTCFTAVHFYCKELGFTLDPESPEPDVANEVSFTYKILRKAFTDVGRGISTTILAVPPAPTKL
eukprot:TRINITY_DN5823_c0_g1_i1.p1 TRINITY_DN5823_c0_g1~~TRINITY_DN5823_c0_g1_i1.p1  ORF type:complete len:242 (-),score=53.91 TRINITY_DN5823_c0_g1_i1:41-745(-)